MNVKLVFFFESVQPATKYASAALGWTETLYGSSNTIGTLDAWLTAPDVLHYMQLRRACMPANYRIAWLRVSDESAPRSFKLMALNNELGQAFTIVVSPGAGIPGGQVLGQVTCALLVDLVRLPGIPGEHTHHRKFLMRALPSDIINGNIVNTLALNWTNIKTFLDWLAFGEAGAPPGGVPLPGFGFNGSLGLRYQNPANTAYTQAGEVRLDPTDTNGISMNVNVGGTPGQQYSFRDFPANVRALNRIWTLRASLAGPPAASLFGRTRRELPESLLYTPPGPGRYRLVVPTYGLFSEYTIIGLRTKKTGRLFRQLRGRSQNR